MRNELKKVEKPEGYVTKEDGEVLVATSPGFYQGRVREGETFTAMDKGVRFTWARSAKAGDITADAGGPPELLDKSPQQIIAALGGLTDREINGLISAEQAGRQRKAILAKMADELANRVGRIGGPAPNKHPEEKDPVPPVGTDPLS